MGEHSSIGFLGFGEAGFEIARGLHTEGVSHMFFCHLRMHDPNRVALLRKRGRKVGAEYVKSVEELVEKLSIQDKINLVRKLENETWAKRLDEVVSRIRKRFREAPISDKEIRQICEETRQRLYNERLKSRN